MIEATSFDLSRLGVAPPMLRPEGQKIEDRRADSHGWVLGEGQLHQQERSRGALYV